MRVMQRLSPVDLPRRTSAKETVACCHAYPALGTKRGLLLGRLPQPLPACSEAFAAAGHNLVAAKNAHRTLCECSGFASTPEAMANGWPTADRLIDPEFHAITWRNSPPSATNQKTPR